MGFSVPLQLLAERWAFTPPFHPYRFGRRRILVFQEPRSLVGGLIFCGTFHRRAFQRSLPPVSLLTGLSGIAPYGVRTFLPRFAPEAILHPFEAGTKLNAPSAYSKQAE